jgi:hypothetical protein
LGNSSVFSVSANGSVTVGNSIASSGSALQMGAAVYVKSLAIAQSGVVQWLMTTNTANMSMLFSNTAAGGVAATLGTNGLLTLSGGLIASNTLALSGPSNVISFTFSGTANSNTPATTAGTAYIFSATNASGTAELYTKDGAGTVKQFSEHNMDAPPSIIDTNDPFPNISMERNDYFGVVRWQNRSRLATVANLQMTVNANSYEAWLGLQAGTNYALLQNNANWANYRTNWATSAMGTRWYNAMKQFVVMGIDQLQASTNESYAAYNARMGYVPGSPGYLYTHTWAGDQAAVQAAYAAGFTNALTAYQAAPNAWGQANPGLPDTSDIAPVWSPPPSNAVPAWMAARGVQ